MEGYEDPFNRRAYPWGREDIGLRDWVARLGALRRDCPALRRGALEFWRAAGPVLSFRRSLPGEELLLCANNGVAPAALALPRGGGWEIRRGEGTLALRGGRVRLTLPPLGGVLLSRSGADDSPTG